jgi:hypothetical protein
MDFQLFFRRSRAGLFSPGLNYQSRIKAPACVRASQEFSNIFFDTGVPAPLAPVGITNRD